MKRVKTREDGSVTVWRIGLRAHRDVMARCWASLSDSERQAAGRYARVEHQERYVVCRGAIREILGVLLGMAPSKVPLEQDEFGKPRLMSGSGKWWFNLSHSEGLALLAVSSAGEVGVDVEALSHGECGQDIAAQWFAPKEKDAISNAPAAKQRELFLFHWVCKEAVLKGVGRGLIEPLHLVDVSEIVRGSEGFARVGSTEWFVRLLQPAPEYVGAVALKRRPAVLMWRDYEPDSGFGRPE